MEHEGGTGSDRDTGHHLAQKNPDSDAEVADVTANVTSADAGRGLLIAEPPSKVAHLPPEIVSRRKNGNCTYTYYLGCTSGVVTAPFPLSIHPARRAKTPIEEQVPFYGARVLVNTSWAIVNAVFASGTPQ